ncbi:hypothetical protein UPYG_G00123180 [Umbra pygmaea]|uniref:Linker for activation of T-cells family member 2 n=1 Tax=Umbra pygmaea TaxID=75934 RepID=A0ABD0X5R9_UMBPY
MTTIFSLQGIVLAIVTLSSVSFFCILCLWCQKKTKIIHETNQIYDHQTFQREGSRFAVMRSKTVTRPNQIIRDLPPTPLENTSQSVDEEQPKYENVVTAQRGSFEPTYVDPIPALVYQNLDESTKKNTRDSETDGDQYAYENVFPSFHTVTRDSDGSDYENSDFLDNVGVDDEPDYVNNTD